MFNEIKTLRIWKMIRILRMKKAYANEKRTNHIVMDESIDSGTENRVKSGMEIIISQISNT